MWNLNCLRLQGFVDGGVEQSCDHVLVQTATAASDLISHVPAVCVSVLVWLQHKPRLLHRCRKCVACILLLFACMYFTKGHCWSSSCSAFTAVGTTAATHQLQVRPFKKNSSSGAWIRDSGHLYRGFRTGNDQLCNGWWQITGVKDDGDDPAKGCVT